MVNLKMVIGVIAGSIGVAVPSICLEVLAIFSCLGEFFRAEKKHMFQKMRQSRSPIRITHCANGYAHGR